MYLDKHREIIENSTHNIPGRLKQIDSGYFVVRNHATNQFEVHHKGQPHNTFCLNIPFDELDDRTMQRVRETSIQYMDNIIKELDRKNAKLEIDRDKKFKDCTETVCKDVYKYVKAHESIETIDNESKYFKQVVG